MAGRGKITPAERRRHDTLRRRGLRTADAYGGRLAASRRKELRRVLKLALDLDTPDRVIDLLEEQLTETGYLPAWWTGLWTEAGLPMAKTTAADLRQAKAAAEEDVWLSTLRRYAQQRAGNEIRVVTGTWKDSLVSLTRAHLEADLGIGIEKLTKLIYNDYVAKLEKWQVRRIAQTEAMIGMADASNLAARTLDVPFVKQWCISGLGNTRASHEAVDGVTVDQDEPFVLEGGMLLYPHDTSLGADASEIINCACDCIRRPKSSASVSPKPVKPQTPPTPEPVPEPAPAPPKPPKPVQAPTPAAPAATVATAATEEQRILSIMAEMPDSLPKETRRAIAENDLALEKKFGIKKGKPMDIEKADKQSANPKHGTADQYGTNCATCSPAYILRTRGFDITAKGRLESDLNKLVAHNRSFDLWKNADGTKAVPTLVGDWLKKKGYLTMTSKRYKEFLEECCKEKGDYILTIKWKGKGSGAHATVLHRGADGKLVNIEPQVYKESKGTKLDIVAELCDWVHGTRGFEKGVMRVDDKIFDTSWAGLFSSK